MKFSFSWAVVTTLLATPIASAQQAPREYVSNHMFWSETVFTGKLAGKFNWQLDYQYRRQGDAHDFDNPSNNPFAHPFQQVIRPWIHYQATPNVRFSLSPMGWWGTWKDKEGTIQKFQPEFRITPQVTLAQNYGRLNLTNRFRYEFRFMGKEVALPTSHEVTEGYEQIWGTHKGRFRYFIRGMVPLNKPTISPKALYINTFNEIFIGTGARTANTNLFDQNRFFSGLGYRFNKHLKLEAGYLLQSAYRFNNAQKNNVEQNHILQVYAFVEDIHDVFKKH